MYQVTGLTAEGRFFVNRARQGDDYFECFADDRRPCANLGVPHGDLSVPVWGPNAGDALATCRPLGVEIWQPAPDLLRGWRAPAVSDYRGGHALRGPEEALHG